VSHILRQVHRGHAAAPDLALNDVPARHRVIQPFNRSHRAYLACVTTNSVEIVLEQENAYLVRGIARKSNGKPR